MRPQLFFELLFGSSQSHCTYQFTSVEVKQLAFRIDGIFLPSSGDRKEPFYLVEVQFQPDEQLYSRIFSELFLYLKQYQPVHPWQVVVIYPTRGVERNSELHFQPLLNLEQVTRIYLDELEKRENSPLGVRLVNLITVKERETPQQARKLLQVVSEEVAETKLAEDIIDLIESIMVYKFPKMSRKEIAGMLGVDDLKQTRFYQEVFTEGKQEGKLEAVSRMLDSSVDLNTIAQGKSQSDIAQWLDLSIEVVKEEANKKQ